MAAADESPNILVLAIGDPIGRADIPALCERASQLLDGSDADVVVCDVGQLAGADLVTVDALARLALTVRRLGRQLRLRGAGAPLRDLLALAGLCDVLPLAPALPVEPGGRVEQREEPRGPEEVVEADGPTP